MAAWSSLVEGSGPPKHERQGEGARGPGSRLTSDGREPSSSRGRSVARKQPGCGRLAAASMQAGRLEDAERGRCSAMVTEVLRLPRPTLTWTDAARGPEAQTARQRPARSGNFGTVDGEDTVAGAHAGLVGRPVIGEAADDEGFVVFHGVEAEPGPRRAG